MLRNPLEAAASLSARDRFPTARSLALWLRYTLEAERNSRSIPRTFVSYAELLVSWRSFLKRIAEDLDTECPPISSRTQLELDRFLSPALYHHRVDDAEVCDQSVTPWVAETYKALRRLRQDPYAFDACRQLDRIASELDKASALFEPALIAFEDALSTKHKLLEKERSAAECARRELEKERALAQSTAQELQKQLKLVQQQRAELHRLVDQLAREEERHARLQVELQSARSALQCVYASKSWRYTAPCRYVAQSIRRVAAAVRARSARNGKTQEPSTEANWNDLLEDRDGQLCVFAHYDPDDDIREYVFYYLERL
ncbi:MAG TPA: hypothetical protein EYP14_13515, partial [Planctomycetaceae bacterium]|nr:hypothetical protein [Planctomycetaceae bacterium]